jgi:acyl-CoA thioesterase-2
MNLSNRRGPGGQWVPAERLYHRAVPTPAADRDVARSVRDLLEVLDVRPTGGDVYRATSPEMPGRRNSFGGQVMGQALRAAAHTAEAGRLPHSLHAYFLREGRFGVDLALVVERTFDGRSQSTRHVRALQGDREIFTLTASFRPVADPGGQTALGADQASPGLDQAVGRHDFGARAVGDVPTVGPQLPAMPVHGFSSAVQWLDAGPDASDPTGSQAWLRVRAEVPDDPVLHACLIAYMSDTRAGMSIVGDIPAEPHPDFGGPPIVASLDHAMWFHRPARADDWLFFSNAPVSLSAARGLVRGVVHDRSGRHVASFAQELLDRQVPLGA